MLYTTARRIASGVRAGDAYLYTDRDLMRAITEMQESSLFGKGLPQFNTDLSALHQELENRMEGTGA